MINGKQMSKSDTTTVAYLYRDTQNFKAFQEITFNGTITESEIAALCAHTFGHAEDVHLFYPDQVGLPDPRHQLEGAYEDDPPHSEIEQILIGDREQVTPGLEQDNIHDWVSRVLATTWDHQAA